MHAADNVVRRNPANAPVCKKTRVITMCDARALSLCKRSEFTVDELIYYGYNVIRCVSLPLRYIHLSFLIP